MSEFEIEKHVPVDGYRHYPLRKMEPQDSFFVEFTEHKTQKQTRAAVASAIHRTQKLYGGKFTMRTVKDEGIRVWCVEQVDALEENYADL